MRPAVLLAFALLTALPATVRAEPEPVTETRKIMLHNLEPNDTVQGLAKEVGFPAELRGLVGYPLDNSVLAQGSSATLRALTDGLAMIDVPAEDLGGGRRRIILKPNRATVEALRDSLQKVGGDGKILVREKELVLEGSPAWLLKARLAALRTEWLSGPMPLQLNLLLSDLAPGALRAMAKVGGAPFQAARDADGRNTLTLPPDTELKVVGDQLVSDVTTGKLTVTGLVTITAANGFKLETTGVRLTISGLKKGEPIVIRLEPGAK